MHRVNNMSSKRIKILTISTVVVASFIVATQIEAAPPVQSAAVALVKPESQPVAFEQVQAAPVTSSTPATVIASVPDPVVVTTYQWSDAMALAGINAADYGSVTDMVLDDSGWRIVGPNLWQHALSAGATQTLEFNLARVNYYVGVTYGSWASADDTWTNTGDF